LQFPFKNQAWQAIAKMAALAASHVEKRQWPSGALRQKEGLTPAFAVLANLVD